MPDDSLALCMTNVWVVSWLQPYVSSVVLPHGMIMDRVERLAADIRKDYGASTPHFLCVLKVRICGSTHKLPLYANTSLLTDMSCLSPTFVCMLWSSNRSWQGAAEFFADLSRALRRHHEYFPHSAAPFTFDFIRVKSYENDTSTGTGKSLLEGKTCGSPPVDTSHKDRGGAVKIMGAELSSMKGRDVIIVEDIIDSGLTMTKLVPLIKGAGANSVKVGGPLFVLGTVPSHTWRGAGGITP